MQMKNYPTKVCQDCGSKASGGKQYEISCWHEDVCDVCGKTKPVTEPRDFYYPEFEGFLKHMAFCNECKFRLDKQQCGYHSWAGGFVDDSYDAEKCRYRNDGNKCPYFMAQKTVATATIKKRNFWQYLKSLWTTK